MNKIYLVFSMLLLMFAFESCQDRTVTDLESDSVLLSLEVSNIEVPGEDTVTRTVKYWSNLDSTYVSVKVNQLYDGDEASWCTAEMIADSKFTIQICQNMSAINDRSAEVIVTSGIPTKYTTDTILVYQNASYVIASEGVYLSGKNDVTGETWEGVIYDVDDDYEYCWIMSLNEVKSPLYNWIVGITTTAEALVPTGATDRYDGAKNMAVIKDLEGYSDVVAESKYPMFTWAAIRTGGDWYVPASEELKVMLKANTVTLMNKTIALVGGTAIDDDEDDDSYYWSSTESEKESDLIYVARPDISDGIVTAQAYSKLSNALYSGRRLRAVLKVKVPDDMKPLK